jgi:CRP/FNR family transcriptional regulator, cyclic AMP receptor protein
MKELEAMLQTVTSRSSLHSNPGLDCRPLAEIAPRMPFWKGTVIGKQGEPCSSIYIIVSGQVLLSRKSLEGEEYSVYLLGGGDLFGEGSLQPEREWMVTARAVTDGAAYVLPSAQLSRFIQYYPDLGTHIVKLLGARLVRSHRRLDLVTSNCARDRVLGLLRVLADHHGQERQERIWLPISVTQTELAEMVGLARETVARVLTALETEGLVFKEGRRGFWLKPEKTSFAAA